MDGPLEVLCFSFPGETLDNQHCRTYVSVKSFVHFYSPTFKKSVVSVHLYICSLKKSKWWSTHKSMNTKKTMIYANGNPGPGLGQAQKCSSVKLCLSLFA